ncbi:MAG: phosphoribosylformylglycinamidine cyclo-ligase [Clostridiales bacterium]|jgi:phosphoribosylformylglycinamidine cyclo-ligase|nr:phosphoribosylformylglycinamidine cyclo-ligase [Clostridiales bacterium]
MAESWTYKKSGVDVNAGYETSKLIKGHALKTRVPGVIGGIGGFGGLFELPGGPVLVAGTDGVGTKLKIAFMTGVHDTVGIDCVAMCVNDVACQGAKPLFFLDYIATGALDPKQAEQIVKGVSDGCILAGCALIGGETAEMPGFYAQGEYDLAGFAVGAVDKERLITGEATRENDILIGVASSGLHSNGFSLVRKLCFEERGFKIDDYISDLGVTLGEALLTPTKIYARLIESLNGRVSGAAHITGGGWIENIPRMFPDRFKAVVDPSKAPAPAIFQALAEWGDISPREMYNTFNMGVGLVVAVNAADAESVLKTVHAAGEKAYVIGEIQKRADGEEGIEFD